MTESPAAAPAGASSEPTTGRLVPEKLVSALREDDATGFELPLELVHASRRRVRVAAAIGTLSYGVFLAVELLGLLPASPLERSIDVTHDVLGVALCAALWLATAWPSLGDRTVLALALGIQVLLCALISTAVPWAGYVRTAHLTPLSWVVPIVILFPLLVPARPRTAIPISIACALLMPLGLIVLRARGAIVARDADVLASALSGGVAVFIATMATRAVYGAGRQIAAARRAGSYELLERLGHGGMGEVWKARHSFLARPAAVKLVLPEMLRRPREDREAVLRRFHFEATVTASLRSPHTVQLYDFGASADGRLYFAMELLEGMNLEHFVYRFGALPARRVVHWLRQACHSLGEAHARGLVHRDIKPGNLFVCRSGRDADVVKILDFGLTRPLGPRAATGRTAEGVVLGTPGYMAPEQVFGLPAGPRTDLYALGCVGWWLLAGKKPFESDVSGELLRMHAQDALPALGADGVPAPLEAVIRTCLAKDPNDRPEDADALAAALESSVDGAPWTGREANVWWSENLAGPS